jgi:hypothetical protein
MELILLIVNKMQYIVVINKHFVKVGLIFISVISEKEYLKTFQRVFTYG